MPDPLATSEVHTADGACIILRRHGNPEGPRLVLSHGNGLAIDLYYPFWSLLMDRFDLVRYDIRSHGWNPTADSRTHNMATFVSDNEYVAQDIDRHFGEKPKIGVFHSMSATVALNHEPPGESFVALVLFDPSIYPPGGNPWALEALWRRFGRLARRRRERFERRDEFVEIVRCSPALARLLPGVADLYAQATIRAAADGKGYELCCPREYEARIFEWGFAYNFEPEAECFSCPVKVIGGDPTGPFSFLPSMDLSALVGLDYDFVPETTHFLQIENPEACVALMLDFLERQELV